MWRSGACLGAFSITAVGTAVGKDDRLTGGTSRGKLCRVVQYRHDFPALGGALIHWRA